MRGWRRLGTTPGARIRPEEVERLALQPLLDPDGCRRLAGRARLNTDDRPLQGALLPAVPPGPPRAFGSNWSAGGRGKGGGG